MEQKEELLKRYYQGETTLTEEKTLKKAWQEGNLPEEPILCLRPSAMPEGLQKVIQDKIRQKQRSRRQHRWITVGSIAAMLVLFFSLQKLLPSASQPLPLSDNLKKERFENALRIIGNAIEEKQAPAQKILYEDHHLIIAVE